MVRLTDANDAAIVRAQAWIADNYATDNPVAAMVERSALLPRTFGRRFRAATGRRPIEYVHEVRIDEARRILESSSIAVDDVGFSVGYQDPTFFRRLFKRKTGLTPAAYRRKFATITPYAERPGVGSRRRLSRARAAASARMSTLPRFHAFRLWRVGPGRWTLAAVQSGSSARRRRVSKHAFRRIGLSHQPRDGARRRVGGHTGRGQRRRPR